jgi:hypothetical protein
MSYETLPEIRTLFEDRKFCWEQTEQQIGYDARRVDGEVVQACYKESTDAMNGCRPRGPEKLDPVQL